MKTKRTYKIIACVSIWLSVIIAFFSLAIAKPKAGIIVEENPTYRQIAGENTDKTYTSIDDIDANFKIALDAKNTLSQDSIFTLYYNDGTTTRTASFIMAKIDFLESYITFNIALWDHGSQIGSQPYNTSFKYIYFDPYNYLLLDMRSLVYQVVDVIAGFGGGFNSFIIRRSTANTHYIQIKETLQPTISAIDNIYDLSQNDIALIYISDISGLSATMTNEITINWGYIDSTDSNLFSVYAPKVGAQLMEADDLFIRLSIPTNNAGSTANTYDISQQAILSLGTGSATATAHIYGIYVWIQESRIQWGLAEFDTTSTPASGQSMNYITSLTALFDYTAGNTQTMTCRLSISDNFNFITIKNQPILSANNINTVIQQGGFLPAWSIYNWARGSASGFISGEQAGAAPYQPGNTGYQAIFEAGRQAGMSESVGTVNWFVSSFQAVDAMLNIRIFPNITIGYLVGIPFVISVAWFIIRMFRGGGSSS